MNKTINQHTMTHFLTGTEGTAWPRLQSTHRHTSVFLTGAILLLVAFCSGLQAQPSRIPWQTMSDGLGSYSEGNLRTVGVLGQVLSGRSADGNTVVTSGFLAGLRSSYTGVLAVEETSGELSGFQLSQNYPNPFNPATTIGYTLKSASFVVLRVQDLLGRTVATLVQETQHAGTYSVQWSAATQSSGLYQYRIEARPLDGSPVFTDQKIMMLVK